MCTAIYVKDVGRMLHAGVHTDVNMAFSTEIDHWPISLQIRMCPPRRTAVKDAPRWDRAAMNDGSLGNEFRFDLRNTLVARAHELDSAGRHFQRLCVLNDTMRGVGSKYFLSWSGPRTDERSLDRQRRLARRETTSPSRPPVSPIPFLEDYSSTSPWQRRTKKSNGRKERASQIETQRSPMHALLSDEATG